MIVLGIGIVEAGPLEARDRSTSEVSAAVKPAMLWKFIGLTIAGLVFGGAWVAHKLRSGSDEAESMAIATLEAWYSGNSRSHGESTGCRRELLKDVPFPEQYVIDGSYPVLPLGRYHVIIYIGSHDNWSSVEFMIQDGKLLNCYVGSVDIKTTVMRGRTRQWRK